MSLLIRNFTKNKISPKALNSVLERFLKLEKIKEEVEVSLVFIGEQRMRRINKASRGIDRPTDVLSFEGSNRDGFISVDEGALYLGEIFICIPKASEQACSNGHSLKKEIEILFIHGLYHLVGYDHITDEDYLVMNRKEKKLLRLIYENLC